MKNKTTKLSRKLLDHIGFSFEEETKVYSKRISGHFDICEMLTLTWTPPWYRFLIPTDI